MALRKSSEVYSATGLGMNTPALCTSRSILRQSITAAVASKLRPRAAILASAAVAPKAEAESFGQRITQAVKKKVASNARPRIAVSASNEGGDGFAERLRKAVQEKSPAKRHKEYAEHERERYKEQAERGRECCPQP